MCDYNNRAGLFLDMPNPYLTLTPEVQLRLYGLGLVRFVRTWEAPKHISLVVSETYIMSDHNSRTGLFARYICIIWHVIYEMLVFICVYSDAGAPGVKYPVIIEQFLGANGLGNGGSCVLPLYTSAVEIRYFSSSSSRGFQKDL